MTPPFYLKNLQNKSEFVIQFDSLIVRSICFVANESIVRLGFKLIDFTPAIHSFKLMPKELGSTINFFPKLLVLRLIFFNYHIMKHL